MKKQMKQVAAATLAALCLGTVTIPTIASAASITITDQYNIVKDEYAVYKVFELDENDAVVVSSITTAVKTFFTDYIPSTDANAIGASDTDAQVASKIGAYLTAMKKAQTEASDPAVVAMARQLALALEKDTTNANDVDISGATVNGSSMQITDLAKGFYLVTGASVDANGDGNADDESVVSSVMLTTANDTITINTKVTKPTVEKKIVEDGVGDVDANTAGVGETVNYKITSAVPDHTYYATYYMKFTDTICDGIDFNIATPDDDLTATVKIGNATLDADDYELVIDGRVMTIEIPDVKGYDIGAAITITYDAVVNENAVVSNTEGNPNKVYLTYSNDPNWDTDGDGVPDDEDENPDTPTETPGPDTPDEPTEDTPEDEVITYLTSIDVYKKDSMGNYLLPENLNGDYVGFTLYNEAGTVAYKIVVDSNGVCTITHDGENASTQVEAEIVKVTENGESVAKLTFSGLTAGVYKLVETHVPTGYTKGPDTIITIAADFGSTQATSTNPPTWTYNSNTPNDFTVINTPGTNLPSTGGIGTTIFTIVGLTLMATAAGAFIIKRKVTAQ